MGNRGTLKAKGSVERANQDIENMLSTWLEDNNTKKWSEGLRFVQLMKNRAHHIGINCSPYEAMFGTQLKVGLKSSSIPHEALLDINSEENLEKLLSPENTTSITETNQAKTTENAQESAEDFQQKVNEPDRVDLSPVMPSEQSPTFALHDESEKAFHTDSNPIPVNENLEHRKGNVMTARKLALSNLQKQATKMLDVSNAKYPAATIGDTVRVRVPDVDRARSDGRNILATVIELTASNLYKLGTKQGVLNQLYSRNQFTALEHLVKTTEF